MPRLARITLFSSAALALAVGCGLDAVGVGQADPTDDADAGIDAGDPDATSTTTGGSGYALGGSVQGLEGGGLVPAQRNDRRDAADLAAFGPFGFPRLLATGDAYDVDVATQPTNPTQVCTVTQGMGQIGTTEHDEPPPSPAPRPCFPCPARSRGSPDPASCSRSGARRCSRTRPTPPSRSCPAWPSGGA